MKIHANIPAIIEYKSSLQSTYSSILQLGDSQKSEITTWKGNVSMYVSYVSGKVAEVSSLKAEAQSLASEFQRTAEEFRKEADNIYRSGHYEYEYDDEGHEIGREWVYDVAAYNAALRRAEEYDEKYRKAQVLVNKITALLNTLERINATLSNNLSKIDTVLSKYTSHLDSIREKGQKNIRKLTNVIEHLQNYANSTEFARPQSICFPTSFSSGGDMSFSSIHTTTASLIKKSNHVSRQPKKTDNVNRDSFDNQNNVVTTSSHPTRVVDNTLQNHESNDCERLIPGNTGIVTVSSSGNDSTILKKNLIKEFDIPFDSYTDNTQIPLNKTPGYQAQHIIPIEHASHPVIKKIGMDMNHASNGILLPVPNGQVHALTTHEGRHKLYNALVEEKLDALDISKPVEDLVKDVYEVQKTLRLMVERGDPIYVVHEKTNKKKPTGIMVGGATNESLQRAYDRCNRTINTRQNDMSNEMDGQ